LDGLQGAGVTPYCVVGGGYWWTLTKLCTMAAMFGQCLNMVSNCLYGEGEWTGATPHIPASQPIPEVVLDTTNMGQEAVVVKNGLRLCGTGSARGSAPILQDKAYWEVKIQQGGSWSAGIASPAADLNKNLGLDHCSWAVTSEGAVRTRGQQEYKVSPGLEEGDVLGFSYDHVELNLYCNGKNLNTPILGIKGTVFPVFYVDEGAILDAVFENFHHVPPSGFERIMIEKALL